MCVSISKLMISVLPIIDLPVIVLPVIVLPGLCVALFGIITGSIGICISQMNQTRQMKYLWIAFVFLVSQ